MFSCMLSTCDAISIIHAHKVPIWKSLMVKLPFCEYAYQINLLFSWEEDEYEWDFDKEYNAT